MKLLIIRHGDPDYVHDTLTEKGWIEARYLSERISKLDVRDFYVSPLGRAKDTASFTLQKMNRTATEIDWLQEFPPRIHRPDSDKLTDCCWDWLPADWMINEDFYRYDKWYEAPAFQEKHVKEEYDRVTEGLDQLLTKYGYVREGHYYRVEQANNDTIVFFCHFGLGCVLISHLLNVSPMVLWHGLCAAPTSVTTITTEERRRGIASFRMNAYGDTSHLYAKGEPPAVSARFCECFDNKEERHD